MKKKFLFTLSAMLALAMQMSADPVSKQDALKEAETFMKARGMRANFEVQKTDGQRRARATASNQNESPYYYVFNNENNGGFVIISGDDRTQRVLGYSDEGHFDVDDMPETAQAWFNMFVNEMDVIDNSDLQGGRPARVASSSNTSTSQTPTHSAVQPMVTAKWFQIDPLNQSCPYYTSGKRCAVGCTAVAMCQILYYYRDRVPAQLPVDIPGYTCSSNSSIKIPTIKAGTTINWNKMFDKIDGSQTSTQLKAVADFLYYSAAALKSDFGQSTSAGIREVKTVTEKYFNFKTPDYETRSTYSYQQWKAKIIAELEQKRPIYYCMNKMSGGSHSVVIDGYDGGELFHVNWGQGGMNNGYFALTVLDPYDRQGEESLLSSTTYTYTCYAYFNMQPLNGYSNEDNETNLTSYINSATGSKATLTYYNYNTSTNSYACGLGIRNTSNNNIIVLKEWSKGDVDLAGGANTGAISYNLSFNDFMNVGLGEGTYRVIPIFKMKGTDFWVECYLNNTFNYISATVSSNSVSLSKANLKPSLKVTNISFPGPRIRKVTVPVKLSVENTGDDFYGSIYLFASRTSSKGTKKDYLPIFLEGGKTANLQMSFCPSDSLTYNVWITTDAAGSNVIGKSSVTIKNATYARNLEMTAINVDHIRTGKTINGTTFEGTVTIRNNSSYPCAEKIVLYLFSNRNGWIGTNEMEPYFLELGAGKSTTLPFKFENLGTKWQYGIGVLYPDNTFIKKNPLVKGYIMTNAPMCYAQDGTLTTYSPTETFTVPSDAVAVDLTGTTGTVKTVVPNSNANTLYYIGSDESVISGLSGKNVIKGSTAESIKLENKKPFYSPKRFVAKNITFKLVPDIGAPKSGVGGWRTLTLPFTPTQIKVNSEAINWFKSGNDENGRMWIKEFSSIAGISAVQVDYAQKLEGNHPYLYAVPNSEWGTDKNLVGKTLVFSATNATVYEKPYSMTGSDAFNFKGTYGKQTLSNIYAISSDGTKFELGTKTVNPFACYFISTPLDTSILEIR